MAPPICPRLERSHIVTLTARIASPLFLQRAMAIAKLVTLGPMCPRVASRAEVPASVAHTAVGPESVRVWPHVPNVNVDRRASVPLGDGLAWPGRVTTPAGRLLIRKMDEHLR
jgi:hypothetical protein